MCVHIVVCEPFLIRVVHEVHVLQCFHQRFGVVNAIIKQSEDIHAEEGGDQGGAMGRTDCRHQLSGTLMPPQEVGQGEDEGVFTAHGRFSIFVPTTGQVDGEPILVPRAVGRTRVVGQARVVQVFQSIVLACGQTCGYVMCTLRIRVCVCVRVCVHVCMCVCMHLFSGEQ
jgi:hypothetical protein